MTFVPDTFPEHWTRRATPEATLELARTAHRAHALRLAVEVIRDHLVATTDEGAPDYLTRMRAAAVARELHLEHLVAGPDYEHPGT